MNHEIQDLARRAVACKHWRWMPGMLWIIPAQPGWVGDNKGRVLAACEDGGPVSAPALVIPDLTDPATLGCLLALVREVRNDAGFHALLLPANENPIGSPEGSRWWVLRGVDTSYSGYAWASEAEALVAALEAAP